MIRAEREVRVGDTTRHRLIRLAAAAAAALGLAACVGEPPSAVPESGAEGSGGARLALLTRSRETPGAAVVAAASTPPTGVTAFDTDAGDAWPSIQAEMSIAVDPNDPLRVAVVTMNGGDAGALLAAASSDGGVTWQQSVVPTSGSLGWTDSDPMAAFDAAGVLHLIHIPTGPDGPGPLGIDMTRSFDGGLTWQPNLRISANLGSDDKVALAVDTHRGSPGFGTIYVAWKWPPGDIFHTRSTDGGATFEPVRRLASRAVSGLDLAVAPDGTVWLVANSAVTRGVVYARSADLGLTFSAPTRLARTHVSWATKPIAACRRLSLVQASVAVDDSDGPRRGTVYVAWNDHRELAACLDACDPANPCDSDVLLSRSEDGGDTWSAPVVVHPEAPPLSDQFHPWLAVDPTDGSVLVAYKDSRDDPSRRVAQTYLARSPDGGRSWAPGWALSSAAGPAGSNFQFGDYQSLAVLDGRAYAAWSDFRRDPATGDLYVGVARYPSPRSRRIVPAAASSPGALGTTWTTSLELVNPGGQAAEVQLGWYPEGTTGGEPATVTVGVGAGAAQRIDDVVAALLGGEGAGAIELVAPPSVVAVTRTATAGGDGSFGQLVPELDPAAGIPAGGEAHLLLLAESSDRTAGARTNLGLVNLTDAPVSVAVALRGDGVDLGGLELTLGPREMRQVNRILTRVTDRDVADAEAVVTVATGPEPDAAPLVLAYASVVDNRSGDPTFLLPAATLRRGQSGTFAAAASLAGAHGTRWSSEAVLANPAATPATLRLALLATGRANPEPATVELALAPGERRRIGDVLGDLFGAAGAGAVQVTVVSGRVMGASRTFNTSPDGTFGQGIPLVPDHHALDSDRRVRLIHLARAASGDHGFRTNLGLVNLSPTAMQLEVELRTADWILLATKSPTLGAGEHRQLDDVLGGAAAGDIADAVALIRVVAGTGRWLAYASVVDNRTGDPVFIGGR